MANDMIEVNGEISTDQNSTIQLDIQSMITSPIIVTDQSSLNNLKLEIEQIKQEAVDKINEVGNFQDLTTNNKTNLVLAINEINSKFGDFITSSDLTLTLTTELSNYVLTTTLISDYLTSQQVESKFASLDFINTTLSQYAKSSVLTSLDARLTRLTSAATLKTPGVVIPAETHFVMNGNKLFLDMSDSSILSSTYAKRKDLLNLQSYVTGLKSEVFVGVCEYTAEECVQDNTKLTDFVQAIYSREPKSGDVVKSSDGYVFKFSTTWEKQGQDSAVVEIATEDKAGIIKLGTLDGELSIKDDAIAVVLGFDNLKNSIGALDALKTNEKSSIVNAINEVRNIAIVSGGGSGGEATIDPDVLTRLDKIEGQIGNLTSLNTNDKTTLVNALNEIKASLSKYAESSALLNYVQTSTLNRTLASYLTHDEFDLEKTNFVSSDQLNNYVTTNNLSGTLATYAKTSSVQQLSSKVTENAALVGNLSDLVTVDKSSIVSSINEVLRTTNEKTPITRTESIEGNLSRLTQSVGPVSTLETTNKSSVVSAINELKGSIDSIYSNGGSGGNIDSSVLNNYATKVEVDTKINNIKQMKATSTSLGLIMPKDEFKIGAQGELTLNFDQGSSLKTTLVFKDELQILEDKLIGGLTFRGIVNQDSTAIDLDNNILNTFIQDNLSRVPQDGDFIEAQDGVVYIFSKSTWYKRNPALTFIPNATTATIGGIKLGSSDGQLSDIGDGVVTVIGFDELKSSVGTLSSLSTNEQNNLVLAINEVNNKFSDYVLTTTLNQYTLKSETLALETKIDETKTLIGDLNNLTFGLKDSVVNTLNLLHSSLANYVESSTLSSYVTTSSLTLELSSYTPLTTTESLTTRVENLENELGVVGNLTTQEKSNLVNAVNELKQESEDLTQQLSLKVNSSDMELVKQEFSRKIEDVTSSIGDISSSTTGLLGNTVSEHVIELKSLVDQKASSSDTYTKSETYTRVEVNQKIDEKIAGTGQFDPSVYYTKVQTDSLLDEKLSTEAYNLEKVNFATTDQLALKADATDLGGIRIQIQSLQTEKLDTSVYNSDKSTFATISQLADKAEASALTALEQKVGTVEQSVQSKVEQSDIDLSLDTKLGNLTISGLSGTTVTDLLTDTKSQLDTKLEVLAANSTFATKTEVSQVTQSVSQLEQKDTQLQQSIDLLTDKLATATGAQITLGTVDEDHTQVDLDKTILTNKVRDLTSKSPIAGQKLYSSDHYEYIYTGPGDTDWLNLGLDKVAFASTSSAGIIKLGTLDGELESVGIDGVVKVKGFDTLKNSIDTKVDSSRVDSLEGRVSSVETEKLNVSTYNSDKATFATIDSLNGIQTQVSAIEGQVTSLQSDKLDISTYDSEKAGFATSLSVTTLEGKVQTLENSSSTQDGKITDIENKIGSLNGTGLTGSTVTELLTDARAKMDSIQAGGIDLSNYYTKGDADGKFALVTSLDDKLDASTYNSEKLSFATTANLSTLSQKVTTVEGTVSTQESSILDLSSKVGDLQNTGLTGTTATELFTDVKTRLDGIPEFNSSDYYTKVDSDSKFALSTDLTNKLDVSVYNSEKSNFATTTAVSSIEGRVNTLENSSLSQGTAVSSLETKIGNLIGTGLNGSTVTELFTDVKAEIDSIDLTEYYTKLESDGKFALQTSLNNKLDTQTYESEKVNFATTNQLSTKVDSSTLVNYYQKTEVDDKLAEYATVTSLNLKADTSTVNSIDQRLISVESTASQLSTSKLDVLTYESDKSTFALNSTLDNYYNSSTIDSKIEVLSNKDVQLQQSIDTLTDKMALFNGSQITLGSVTQDHNEIDLDKSILSTKIRELTSQEPIAGQKLYSSDSYEYLYVGPGDTDWLNLGLDKAPLASTTSAGIVKLGSVDGQLESVGIDGVVHVKGFDTLTTKVTQLESSKTETSVTTALSLRVDTLESSTNSLSSRVDGVEAEKLNISVYDSEKVNFATTSQLADKADQTEVTSISSSISSITTQLADKADSSRVDTIEGEIQTLNNSISQIQSTTPTLSGSQTFSGSNTYNGNSIFNNRVSINTGSGITDYVMRFIGDSWSNGQATTLVGFWKGGLQSGYKIYLNSGNFNYAELHGLTLVSNMKDPTAASHGANKRYVDNQVNSISNGTKPFGTVIKAGLNGQEVKFSPEDDSTKRLRFSNSSVGTNCKFILDFENTIVSENVPDPTSDTQLSNKRYVDTKVRENHNVFQSTDTITTSNLPVGAFGYKLSSTS